MSVHLACERLDVLLAGCPDPAGWLSAQEQERLQAIRNERRRAQFVAGHWQARLLLARAEDEPATHWTLAAPADAPPAVPGRPDLHLSISHSGDWVACALARSPVGVDLETPRRGRDIGGLAALCCTPGERLLLAQAPSADALFLELWTVKESWLKCRAEGVSPARLARLDAAPGASGEVRTWQGAGWCLALCGGADPVRWTTQEPRVARQWRVADLPA